MAYIGNTPAENYASFLTETFTVSATTNYTLSHAVANENDIRLVINGVVQQPGSGKAYTASGTTLTLTSATASGDVMYAVYLGRALQTVNPPSGSVGTAQLASEAVTNDKVASTVITGQTAETSIATDDTILIHDTSASALRKITRANFVSGVGGTNTPAFFAHLGSNQNISTGTHTTVALNTEIFDTNNGFDTGTYKYTIPSGQGGKYLITACIRREGFNPARFNAYVLKNNSVGLWNGENVGGSYDTAQGSSIVSLSAGDVIHLLIYHTNGNTQAIMNGLGNTFFGAFKLVE